MTPAAAASALRALDLCAGLLLTATAAHAGALDPLLPLSSGPLRHVFAGLLVAAPFTALPACDHAEPWRAALVAGLAWVRALGLAVGAGLAALSIGAAVGSPPALPDIAAVLPLLNLLCLASAWPIASRLSWRAAVMALVRRNVIQLRAAILGAGPRAGAAMASLARERERGVQVVGLVADQADDPAVLTPGLPHLGAPADLLRIVQLHAIDLLVVAPSHAIDLHDDAAALRRLPVRLRFLLQEPTTLPRARLRLVAAREREFVELDRMPLQGANALAKRCFDIAVAASLLAWLLPALLVIALAIRLDSPGPILFRQRRHGLRNRVFSVYKFRTMRAACADPGGARQTGRDDPRLTRLGGFLRRHSLDELPQLLNVLLGDMSLVGPRPHALSTEAAGVPLEQASRAYLARTCVRPGITGLAQVSGWRGALDSLDKLHARVEHDVAYIEGWSFGLDLWILLRTLGCLVRDRRAC